MVIQETKDDLMVKALDWDSKDLSSIPGSATEFLCDLGQVTFMCLCFSSLAVKWR